jgi:RNA polymerase sigma-70 factor (ECF subfamily)
MEKLTDMELVEIAKAGSQAAFEMLIGRYANKAYGLCFRLTRNKDDAEEALQDTFVNVYTKLRNFEGKSAFASWLFRVTANTALMKLRKRRQHSRTSLVSDLSEYEQEKVSEAKNNPLYEPDNATNHAHLSRALKEAIEKLPEEFRAVFMLRDVDGMSTKAVGKILNLSEPAVKSRLHRSRLLLRRKLSAFYEVSNVSERSEIAVK